MFPVKPHWHVCSAHRWYRQLESGVVAAGTFPLQSERMYSALQGHGCKARLVVLPHESHGYRAHESVMHVLAEKEQWLDVHCVARGVDSESSRATQGEEKAAAREGSDAVATAVT